MPGEVLERGENAECVVFCYEDLRILLHNRGIGGKAARLRADGWVARIFVQVDDGSEIQVEADFSELFRKGGVVTFRIRIRSSADLGRGWDARKLEFPAKTVDRPSLLIDGDQGHGFTGALPDLLHHRHDFGPARDILRKKENS